MKEKWINKLIKLLNEYDDWMVSWYEEYFSTEWLFVTNAGQCFREEFILSKRYWFIKWLVDNDKIEPLWKYIGWETDEDEPYIKFDLVDQYIAYLSIQDNPIEFLCEILK